MLPLAMRNHAVHALCFTAALLTSCARNISAQVPTAFDNTRITPANEKVGKLLEVSNDTIAAAQITLLDLLKVEHPGRIVGLTDQQENTRFDVTARIDPPGVADPVHNRNAQTFLVDALLRNHFAMKAHEGMVDITTERLVVAPGGIKFSPAPARATAACACPTTPRIRGHHLDNGHLYMSGLAHELSDQFHIGVEDSTNLQGAFGINLDWLTTLNITPQTAEQVLSKALQTHLGLTFIPTHRQEKAFIVDYIEIPASVVWLPPPAD